MTKRVAPWLGALVATPAITLSVESAAASAPPTSPGVSVTSYERAALKAGLLSMGLDEKLAIAGDRLGADPYSLGAPRPRTWGAAATYSCGGSIKGGQQINTGTCRPSVEASKCGQERGGMQAVTKGNSPALTKGNSPAITKGSSPAITKGASPAITKGNSPALAKCGATAPGAAALTKGSAGQQH